MRVNIEHELRTDSRFTRLMRLTGWREPYAVGYLYLLWFNSQKDAQVLITRELLLEWCQLEDEPEHLDSLIKCRFIIAQDDGLFTISGNKKQLESVSKWHDKRVNAGKARAKSATRNKDGLFNKKSTPINTDQTKQSSTSPAHAGDSPAHAGNSPAQSSSVTVTVTDTVTDTVTVTNIKKKRTLGVNSKWVKLRSQFDTDLAESWRAYALQVTPNGKYKLDSFIEAITKMRINLKMSEEQIRFLFGWVKQDEFWSKRGLSPASLLKPSKSDPEISKLDQVIISIQSVKKTHDQKLQETMIQVEAELEAEQNGEAVSMLSPKQEEMVRQFEAELEAEKLQAESTLRLT